MVSHDDIMENQQIVISGISGRFPNSDNVSEFQYNLLNTIDCTTTDHNRWEDFESKKLPQRLGVYNNVTKFDRVFFGVHAKLTPVMDPVSRLMLEHSFEAIMDAGINPRKLKGANVAVYTATSMAEAEKGLIYHNVQQSGFGIMGSSKAMLPNRISFFLGLNGSSINIDSGDTGAGTALEKAYYAIKNGQCDAAIVAGACQCLHPQVSYQLKELGLLSTDGFTRCFDDNANGYTRSEAITAFYIQRAKDAKRIYMEIVNTRTIHADSIEKNSLLYPKMDPQIQLMKELLRESSLTPDDISFIEASGTAIKDIDTEELNAIATVYEKRRKPLLIGSVKSIVGNTVSANSFVSILKMIIASETGQMAPNLHYKVPNSRVPSLVRGQLKVLSELSPWSGPYSVVNTVSTNATVSHTILRAPDTRKKNNGVPEDNLPRLVVVSGRTEEAITSLLDYMDGRPLDAELLQLLYDVFQSDIDGHLYRGYSIVPAKGLVSNDSKKREFFFNSGERKEVWWIFSGMGSQWVGMGTDLLKLPVFEAAIRKCDAVLKPQGYDVFKIITEKDPKIFDQIINSFVGIAAIQIGLVDVLRAVGLEPDYIIGHSVGELGCAYADGCFTAEQMVMAALSRGLASTETKLEKGSMAAVGLGYADIKPLCPSNIDVACHNGPESSTISGPAESMRKFVASLTAKGIFAREVPCSNIAYHSRYISSAGPKLLERLQTVIPKPNPRSSKWVSTSIPRGEWNTLKARLCSAEYHTNNLLSPVLFEETSRLIPPNAVCVEIAPHGLLQAILKRSLPKSCINVALTRRSHPDNLEVLLTALGKLYNVGLQPKISNLYPKIQYPVGKGTPSISSLIKWDHSADWIVNFYAPSKERREGEKTITINLTDDKLRYLQGNVINGKFIIPLSLCLIYAWEILKSQSSEHLKDVVYEEIKIYNAVIEVPNDNIINLTVVVPKGTQKFEIMAFETLVVTGIIRMTKTPNEERLNTHQMDFDKNKLLQLNQEDFYLEMEMRGYQYSKAFKKISKSSTDGTRALIKWDNNWVTFIDCALQLFTFGNDLREVEVPLLIRKIVMDFNLQESSTKISEGVQAFHNKKLNYLSCGGLEIQGPKFTVMPRDLEQQLISNDILSVVPNIEKSGSSLSASLRVIFQIVLENTFSKKIPKMEIIENNNLSDIDALKCAMYNIPENAFFKTETISYKKTKFNKTLTIILDDLRNYDVQALSQSLESGGFLLLIINSNLEDMFTNLVETAGLKVVITRKNYNNYLLLLRKKQSLHICEILNVTEDINKTISEIKNVNTSTDNRRILVVIRSDNIKHVAKYVNHIEKALNLDKLRIINIQNPNVSEKEVFEKLCERQLETDLLINVLTVNNTWATLRRTKKGIIPKLSKHWIANQKSWNNPYEFIWTESPNEEKTDSLVKVQFSALNKQDILIARKAFFSDMSEIVGKNRILPITIGLEYSGIDSKGNRIMGISSGNSMSNFTKADQEWTWYIPKSWSLEDAATIPLSYIIAYSVLCIKTNVKARERVLIINSCDGSGLAIFNLALQKDCDIFVTYETDEEKKIILSMAPNFPFNRLFKLSENSLQDNILLATMGQGIDVVICNNCEIRIMEKLFSVTKQNARIVLVNDLSDNELYENIGMEIFLKEINFYSVVPRNVLSLSAKIKKVLRKMMKDGIENGCVKPLPRTVYDRESLNTAFTALLKQPILGKILVKVQPDDPNQLLAATRPRFFGLMAKTYLILEGLTQFGLELVDWLVTRGASHLIITSSQKCSSGYKDLRMKVWKNYGVQLILHENFSPTENNIRSLFNEASSIGPIDAIFDLQRCILSKEAELANNLNLTTKIVDEVSRSSCKNLRLFVICYITSNIGSLALIKKCLPLEDENLQHKLVETILEQRKKDGLPGLIIKWGLIDCRKEHIMDYDTNIVLPPITKYIQELDECLFTEENLVEISCTVPHTKEVCEYVDDVESLDPAQKDAKKFTTSLYENYGVGVDNMYLYV